MILNKLAKKIKLTYKESIMIILISLFNCKMIFLCINNSIIIAGGTALQSI